MLETTTITENTVSPNHEFRLLTTEDLRALRRDDVFRKAQQYQKRFWEFAYALYHFDLNQDWKFELNATQEGCCKSLSEFVAAHQAELQVSPSWAMYMAGLPGIHQTIQNLIDPLDTTLKAEVNQLVHNTDPTRLQVVQSTVRKAIRVAQAIKVQQRVNPDLVGPDDYQEAVARIIEPLQVAHEAETREDVEQYVDETKGIVHRTIHISVGELDQLTRSRFEISDLPKDAIVALDVWYNPKKQAEYRAEMAAKTAGSSETGAEDIDSSSEPEQA